MDLYASGFNAWRQLQFDCCSDAPDEPDDIQRFQRVLSDQLIEVQYASLTCTIVNTSSGLQYAGSGDNVIESAFKKQLLSGTAAIAGNGTIAIYDGVNTISQHNPWLPSSVAGRDLKFAGMGDIIQLVAYETGFAALSKNGKVWSWGDERYTAPLGREVTATRPAARPGPVEDLDDLPSGKVKRIAAAGYIVLALTESNDLYAWGGHPASRYSFPDIRSSPAPVDVEDKDILDCSVGEAHMIVLASDGSVYVTGENTNGQLGLLGGEGLSWEKVPLSIRAGHAIVGVKAGQRSSFIISRNTQPA